MRAFSCLNAKPVRFRTGEPEPSWRTLTRSAGAVKEESERFGRKLLEGVGVKGTLVSDNENFRVVSTSVENWPLWRFFVEVKLTPPMSAD